jgi:hypothetical protein
MGAAIETALSEAERFGALACLAGAPFPHAAVDKDWRLLAFGAHHDGITGVEWPGRVRYSQAIPINIVAG